MTLAELLLDVGARGEITADDALRARRAVYGPGGPVSRATAEAVFDLNDAAARLSPEWRAFFCEVVVDVVVLQRDPPGYVDEASADWLMARVSKDRRLRADELEALLRVLERADQTPRRFEAFVLRLLLEKAHADIRAGAGLGAPDVERLRRAVFAAGGEDDVEVAREEAEALVTLNQALKGQPADPAWADFFARAVGAALLHQGVWRPDAAAERARLAWLADPGSIDRRTLKDWREGLKEGFGELRHLDFADHDLEKAYAAEEALEAEALAMTAEKTRWLRALIGRDGTADAAERSLLAFVAREARTLDPAFSAWIAELGVDPAEAPQDHLGAAPAPAFRPQFGRKAPPAA